MRQTPQPDLAHLHVLDGGLATELERRGCDISGPLWSARVLDDAPEAIRQLHLDYLCAGADCISTASYQVSAMGYAELGRPRADAVRAIRQSVEIAEQAMSSYARESNRHVLIAVSLGPYGAALHNGAEFHGQYGISFDELTAFHAERLAAAADTSADFIALETVPSNEEAGAIMEALKLVPEARAWLSFTCRDAEHVAHGERLTDCVALADKSDQILAIGVNCTHPKFVTSLIAQAKSATNKPILVYPNSGETWDAATHRWIGKSDPADFGLLAAEWFRAGAHAVGGCCRTSPDHIRAVRAALDATRV